MREPMCVVMGELGFSGSCICYTLRSSVCRLSLTVDKRAHWACARLTRFVESLEHVFVMSGLWVIRVGLSVACKSVGRADVVR